MRSRLMQYRSDPLMQYHSGVDTRQGGGVVGLRDPAGRQQDVVDGNAAALRLRFGPRQRRRIDQAADEEGIWMLGRLRPGLRACALSGVPHPR